MSAIGSFLDFLNMIMAIPAVIAGTHLVVSNAYRIFSWHMDRRTDNPWRLHAFRTCFRLAVGATCLLVFVPRVIALVVAIFRNLTTVI
ncbi:hypothetical protein [Micromonospora profundi]|uniref:hypothetical protein n=1 Tax=Micromonospora profundi TaxID=1420889 RepID=UPI0036512CB2